LGLRDDGREHTMVIALLYDDTDTARRAGPVLHQRLRAHQLSAPRRPLRELAEPGEPESVATAGGTVLVAPLAIRDIEQLGLWGLMAATRDYPFLAG
jgi:hypothetical protein